MQAARPYARFACVALALSAGTAGCSQPDDIVVSVQPQLVDGGGMMTGSGGMTAGTAGMTAGTGGMTAGTGGMIAGTGGTQSPAPSCAVPEDWAWSANNLMPETGCRVPHGDPVIAFVDKLYMDRKLTPPLVGEGGDVTRCDVDLSENPWPAPYFQEPKYLDDYTLCPGWCLLMRGLAAAALNDYRRCMMDNTDPMQQP